MLETSLGQSLPKDEEGRQKRTPKIRPSNATIEILIPTDAKVSNLKANFERFCVPRDIRTIYTFPGSLSRTPCSKIAWWWFRQKMHLDFEEANVKHERSLVFEHSVGSIMNSVELSTSKLCRNLERPPWNRFTDLQFTVSGLDRVHFELSD